MGIFHERENWQFIASILQSYYIQVASRLHCKMNGVMLKSTSAKYYGGILLTLFVNALIVGTRYVVKVQPTSCIVKCGQIFRKHLILRKQMYRLWTASYSKAFFRYLFLVHWQSGKRKKVPKRSIFKMQAKKKSRVFEIHKIHMSYVFVRFKQVTIKMMDFMAINLIVWRFS